MHEEFKQDLLKKASKQGHGYYSARDSHHNKMTSDKQKIGKNKQMAHTVTTATDDHPAPLQAQQVPVVLTVV